MQLYANITPSEHRAWARQYIRNGFMPNALRYAIARNTQAVIAAAQGSEKAGKLSTHLTPGLTEEERAVLYEKENTKAAAGLLKDLL